MLLWVLFAVMTAATLAAVLTPLARPGGAPDKGPKVDGDDGTLAVYRDQLKEIEAERARGLIDAGEAEAARLEISRRLLGAADAQPVDAGAGPAAANVTARHLAVAIAAIAPLATLALYLTFGSPGEPAQPFASRANAPLERAPVADLVAKVEARLREVPQDGKGWDVIAPVYFKLGRYRDAADAYQRAGQLLGESVVRLGGFVEASIFAADGIVTEEARRACERMLVLEPGRVEPRFWLALAKEQDGKLEEAKADYAKLLADAPANAPWRDTVEQRLAEVSARLSGAPLPEASGPTPEDIAAAQRLSPAQRQRMIESMVDGLAQRLKQDGRDLAGWLRLVRAYTVLERKEDARKALADARKALASDERAMAELSQLAKSLGLDS